MLGEELMDIVEQSDISALISENLHDVSFSGLIGAGSTFNLEEPIQVFEMMPAVEPKTVDDSVEPCQLCNRPIKKKGMRAHIQRAHSEELQNASLFDSSSNSGSSGSSTPVHDHTKERCKFCPRFIKKKGMKAHLERVHTVIEKFHQCLHCPKKFKCESYLKTHVKKMHPIIYTCMRCSFMSESVTTIETHVHVEHGIDLAVPLNLNPYIKIQPTVVKKKKTA